MDLTALTTPRVRLDYLTSSHYKDILLANINWPFFLPYFVSRNDTQRYLEDFSSYRNDHAHVRDATPFKRREGDNSLVWLERALTKYEKSDV